ncbi:MAG: hypothetical protein EAZ20_10270 [Bacteroidetes bacterium]|nr:MAG: hypothetical protein EAZ20_10270 [Bacteroidota bacterium]
MESIYETSNGSTVALLNEEDDFYVLQLIGKVSKTHYQAALNAILEDAEARECGNLLLNVKDMIGTPDPWQWWFTNHFIRKLDKLIEPKVYVAVVHPLKFAEKYTVPYLYAFLRLIGWKINVNFFKNIQKATQWLEKNIEKPKDNSFSSYSNYSNYFQNNNNFDFDFEDDDENNDENNDFFSKKTNKKQKKTIKEKISENFKIKKKADTTSIEIGKKESKFKFKFHFDKKGGFEKKPMVERFLPKFQFPSWLGIRKKDKDDF